MKAKTIPVVAVKEHVYDTRRYKEGDSYDAQEKDVFILQNSGLVQIKNPGAASKGQYNRRDMRAKE